MAPIFISSRNSNPTHKSIDIYNYHYDQVEGQPDYRKWKKYMCGQKLK